VCVTAPGFGLSRVLVRLVFSPSLAAPPHGPPGASLCALPAPLPGASDPPALSRLCGPPAALGCCALPRSVARSSRACGPAPVSLPAGTLRLRCAWIRGLAAFGTAYPLCAVPPGVSCRRGFGQRVGPAASGGPPALRLAPPAAAALCSCSLDSHAFRLSSACVRPLAGPGFCPLSRHPPAAAATRGCTAADPSRWRPGSSCAVCAPPVRSAAHSPWRSICAVMAFLRGACVPRLLPAGPTRARPVAPARSPFVDRARSSSPPGATRLLPPRRLALPRSCAAPRFALGRCAASSSGPAGSRPHCRCVWPAAARRISCVFGHGYAFRGRAGSAPSRRPLPLFAVWAGLFSVPPPLRALAPLASTAVPRRGLRTLSRGAGSSWRHSLPGLEFPAVARFGPPLLDAGLACVGCVVAPSRSFDAAQRLAQLPHCSPAALCRGAPNPRCPSLPPRALLFAAARPPASRVDWARPLASYWMASPDGPPVVWCYRSGQQMPGRRCDERCQCYVCDLDMRRLGCRRRARRAARSLPARCLERVLRPTAPRPRPARCSCIRYFTPIFELRLAPTLSFVPLSPCGLCPLAPPPPPHPGGFFLGPGPRGA